MCPSALPILEPHTPEGTDVGRKMQSTLPTCTPPRLASVCLVVFWELDADAQLTQVSQTGKSTGKLVL